MVTKKAPSKQSKNKRKWELSQQFVRLTVVGLCIAGFIYQTLGFLTFYWTYPTVVDIQQTSPTYLEIPAFTICNSIGYNFSAICDFNTGQQVCLPIFLVQFAKKYICQVAKESCENDTVVPGTKFILYMKFLTILERISQEDAKKIAIELEDYMSCTIEFAGLTRKCNLENVLGSFYTKDTLPQFCYTIYSLWGKVDKEREKIPKGAKMNFIFNMNASRTLIKYDDFDVSSYYVPAETDEYEFGKHNLPTSPYVQLAVHSPYFLPSPYMEGTSFHGGKAYEVRIAMDEKNLLPAPYQTNCTNYMKKWKENNGRGPINQLNVVQECRMLRWYEELGCVPVNIDYPHTHPICGNKTANDPKNIQRVAEDKCSLLADSYNQPCHSISYETTKASKDITIKRVLETTFLKEELRTTISGYDCSDNKVWRPACSVTTIEILFDRFEISNLTYNAKYESLELFSVLGGYMGMWLGISLVTIYDFIGSVLTFVKVWAKKRQGQVKRIKNSKTNTFPNGWGQDKNIRYM